MIPYDLMTALTAITAYAIIIIANTELSQSLKKYLDKPKDELSSIFQTLISLFPLAILGLAYLTGILLYIIVNSEIPQIQYLKYYIFVALAFSATINHFDFFYELYKPLLNKGYKLTIPALSYAFWILTFFSFSFTLGFWFAVFMSLIMAPIIFLWLLKAFRTLVNKK